MNVYQSKIRPETRPESPGASESPLADTKLLPGGQAVRSIASLLGKQAAREWLRDERGSASPHASPPNVASDPPIDLAEES